MTVLKFLNSRKAVIFLAAILTIIYYHFFVQRAYVEIDITVSQRTNLKIYWAKAGNLYSEKNRTRQIVGPSQNLYGFHIAGNKSFDRLRIDPGQYIGDYTIRSIRFHQRFYAPVEISSPGDFEKLKPLSDIQESYVDGDGFHIVSSGIDSQFEFVMPRTWVGGGAWRCVVECAVIFLMLFLLSMVLSRYREGFAYILPMYAVVGGLILTMAVISVVNVHPDEYVHIDAASYYVDHWLPPAIDSDEIRHTYSVYGVSRLNTPEIAYLFAGKFQALLAPLHLENYVAFRLFNVCLFFIILLLVFHKREFRPVALALLISPQIWYLFGYCNSDAFAIFVATVISCQLVNSDSLFNRHLLAKTSHGGLLKTVALGILFGFLLLSKKNYYFFLLFAGGYCLWKLWGFPRADRKTVLLRLVAIGLVGLSLFGIRRGLDYQINGMDRSAKLRQIRRELAKPLYNPDTPLHEKHVFLYMKERGYPLKNVVTVDRWFEKTFRSGFGSYGYFTNSATETYYDLVRYAGLAMLLFLGVSALLSRSWGLMFLSGWTYFCAVLLIAASLYHSWTADFQSQGRYLLGIALMFAVLFSELKNSVNMKVFTLLHGIMFLLAVYSFVFVGIYTIPKIVPV